MKIKNILDEKNQYLVSQLLKDGRTKYTTLAKELKVTPAAVKERVERLIEKKILKIGALLNLQKLYPLTASIGVETDADGVNLLIRKLRNCPLVFHLIKTSGNHNLIINILAPDIALIDDFINKQIRSEPGIKHVEVNLGNTITLPEFANIRLFYPKNNEVAPCGLRYDDEMRCSRCPAFSKE
jgi:Lrp/AsnC family transcriptional regulator for asnA, asnC and gidA